MWRMASESENSLLFWKHTLKSGLRESLTAAAFLIKSAPGKNMCLHYREHFLLIPTLEAQAKFPSAELRALSTQGSVSQS